MSKFLWRIFVLILLATALFTAIAFTKTSFLPLIVTSIVSVLFLILELPNKGLLAFIQKRIVRFIFVCAIFIVAFTLFQQGLSELTDPLISGRYFTRALLEAVRSLLGPIFTAILFFILSILCAVSGFTYLLTGKVPLFSHKPYKAD